MRLPTFILTYLDDKKIPHFGPVLHNDTTNSSSEKKNVSRDERKLSPGEFGEASDLAIAQLTKKQILEKVNNAVWR